MGSKNFNELENLDCVCIGNYWILLIRILNILVNNW